MEKNKFKIIIRGDNESVHALRGQDEKPPRPPPSHVQALALFKGIRPKSYRPTNYTPLCLGLEHFKTQDFTKAN